MTLTAPSPLRPPKVARKHWPKDAVGYHLTVRIPIVKSTATVEKLGHLLKDHIRSFDTIHYLYVVDRLGKLIGIVSVKDLYRHDPHTPVKKIATTDGIITIRPEEPQDKAAYLALKHDIKAIPVVSKTGILLGVVPGDTILKILYRDTREDLLRLAHIRKGREPFDHVLTTPISRLIGHRAPWLFLGLLGGFISVHIISRFEATLEANVILAAFIPLVVYMSDAIKTQMEIFLIRDIAIERNLRFVRYFIKQGFVTLCLSLLFSGSLFLFTWLFEGDAELATAVALALGIAIISSLATGLLVPYLFSRTRLDPANTSGPIATVLQDIVSISLYFAVTTWLLA